MDRESISRKLNLFPIESRVEKNLYRWLRRLFCATELNGSRIKFMENDSISDQVEGREEISNPFVWYEADWISILCHGNEWIEKHNRTFLAIVMLMKFVAVGPKWFYVDFLLRATGAKTTFKPSASKFDKLTMVRKGTTMTLGDSRRPKNSNVKHSNTVHY